MDTDSQVKKELQKLWQRNSIVDQNKAWETSKVRTISILVLTYLLAGLTLHILEVNKPWLGSLIPTLGYFLSIQTLPFIKKAWLKKYY